MDKQTIFYLEGRGGMYLFHFFIFNLGALYYILQKNYSRGYPNTSVLLEDKSKIVETPTTIVEYPYKIYMKDIIPFQREAFELLKDKFELIEDLHTLNDYEIVSMYGELCVKTRTSDNKNVIYPFLRNLFIEKFPNTKMINGKRIFITRKHSEKQHSGNVKRSILNEPDVIQMLKKYDFEFIQLEDYSMSEKIKLFMESETILSSHSGSLTLTLFANEKAKIIEILNKGTTGFNHTHYVEIAETVGLNYTRYSKINEDHNGNFNLNINEFETFLCSVINSK
jgi:capsular polysaccharide biosynthesis protein